MSDLPSLQLVAILTGPTIEDDDFLAPDTPESIAYYNNIIRNDIRNLFHPFSPRYCPSSPSSPEPPYTPQTPLETPPYTPQTPLETPPYSPPSPILSWPDSSSNNASTNTTTTTATITTTTKPAMSKPQRPTVGGLRPVIKKVRFKKMNRSPIIIEDSYCSKCYQNYDDDEEHKCTPVKPRRRRRQTVGPQITLSDYYSHSGFCYQCYQYTNMMMTRGHLCPSRDGKRISRELRNLTISDYDSGRNVRNDFGRFSVTKLDSRVLTRAKEKELQKAFGSDSLS